MISEGIKNNSFAQNFTRPISNHSLSKLTNFHSPLKSSKNQTETWSPSLKQCMLIFHKNLCDLKLSVDNWEIGKQ